MRGILLEMAIVTTACCIILSIMGVKYAILLGMLTGLFNIIPYAGIYTAMCISSMVTFATGGAVTKAIWVAVSVFSVHLIDSNVLLPVIVGSRVKINAFATITGLVAGAMIWGIAGVFLSLPIMGIMKIIFDRVESLKPLGLILGNGEGEDDNERKRLTRV